MKRPLNQEFRVSVELIGGDEVIIWCGYANNVSEALSQTLNSWEEKILSGELDGT